MFIEYLRKDEIGLGLIINHLGSSSIKPLEGNSSPWAMQKCKYIMSPSTSID